jgi:hypothetical protein
MSRNVFTISPSWFYPCCFDSQCGVGKGAVGSSFPLVAPAEDKAYSRNVEAAQVHFNNVIIDGRLLSSAQERTNQSGVNDRSCGGCGTEDQEQQLVVS